MQSDKLKADLINIFLTVFPDYDKEIIQNISITSSTDWDSLKQIELIAEIEDFFEIEIDMEDLTKISNFESALEVISKFVS